MATYNIDITSKAIRNFNENLCERLVSSHHLFDKSVPARSIRVIRNLMNNASGGSLHAGGGGNAMNKRYIRIIIDIPAGRETQERKRELLQRTTQCCIDYQGKHASACDIEVRINEVDEQDVMRTSAAV